MEKIFISALNNVGIMGGGPALFLRISDWLGEYGYESILIAPEQNSICDSFQKEIDKRNIRIRKIYSENKVFKFNEKINTSNNEILCIAFSRESYALFHSLFGSQENVRMFFYIIHWGGAIANRKYGILGRLLVKEFCLPLTDHNALACMDSLGRELLSNYSYIPLDKIKLVNLGHLSQQVNNEFVIKRHSGFQILTVARFDFPFKGYIIGLIKDFAILANKYSDVHLKIIGDGEGRNVVYDELSKLSKEVRDRIELTGNIDYSELYKYYVDADLYVGMGTTVLEAASMHIVSIVADTYQLSNRCLGFFDEIKSLESSFAGEYSQYLKKRNRKLYSFLELLEDAYLMDDINFAKKSQASFDTYNNNFTMDIMMRYFMDERYGKKARFRNIHKLARDITLKHYMNKIER